ESHLRHQDVAVQAKPFWRRSEGLFFCALDNRRNLRMLAAVASSRRAALRSETERFVVDVVQQLVRHRHLSSPYCGVFHCRASMMRGR
ncbi:hypothetical protein, partial [Xanthomonas arboricola]|uniref:hypothetical protein n=1 Tax=Xanthomonas arboricola TaxID=56448 RepID=UPI0019559B67